MWHGGKSVCRLDRAVDAGGAGSVQQRLQLLRHTHHIDPSILDVSNTQAVAFVLLGGSALKHWFAENYLRALDRPEVHLYDSDVEKYAEVISAVNERGLEDGSWGAQTTRREIENYLHADAIKLAFGVEVAIPDHCDADGHAVPTIFSNALYALNPVGQPNGRDKAKQRLAAKAFPCMTAAMLKERDPQGEVEGWLRRIGEML